MLPQKVGKSTEWFCPAHSGKEASMLVLSRRPGEKILFPSLGVSVEVLRSRGSVVRLGIEAPAEIPIIRGEIAESDDPADLVSRSPSAVQRHELRNQLNQLTLKLELLRMQLEAGQADQPDRTLSEAISDLSDLERRMGDREVVGDEVKGRRVLIVEDQDAERELLASCLRLNGMNVATVGDGNAALDYLKTHEPPELLLLDMRLPGIDGPTLLDTVRHDRRLDDVRVFAVSGSERTEFGPAPLDVDGWFSKPIRVDALLHAVNFDRSSTKSSL
jgi:carbon storage regulator CsrA